MSRPLVGHRRPARRSAVGPVASVLLWAAMVGVLLLVALVLRAAFVAQFAPVVGR